MAQTLVTFQSGAQQFEGYLARPEGAGPFPGLVIIHEIFGLNENIKDIARRFADAGYAALAVDLFAGRNRAICMFRFMGQMMLNPLNNESIQNLKDTLTFLSEQPGVDAAHLGAVKAIAPYYGANPRPLEAVARMCPVVGSYPDKDFTTSAGQKLDAALTRYDVPHDIKIYPNTRHSFFNDQGPAYAEAAARDSWPRILSFFSEHIGASTVAIKE